MVRLARAMGTMVRGLEHWSVMSDDTVVLASTSLDGTDEYSITAGMVRAAERESEHKSEPRVPMVIGEPPPLFGSQRDAGVLWWTAFCHKFPLADAVVHNPLHIAPVTAALWLPRDDSVAIWVGQCSVHGAKWSASSQPDGSLPPAGEGRPMFCPECMQAHRPVTRLLAWRRPASWVDTESTG